MQLERKIGELLEAAPDAMIVVDAAGAMVLVNSHAEQLFDYPSGELTGQPVEILVPTRFRSRHPRHREGYFGAPRVREMGSGLELYGARRDGSEFPVEISLSPFQTDNGLLIISAIRDVTERKKARVQDLLLKEIHHRVKNNLQVISSLLKLHGNRMTTDEARDAFDDAEQRVRAIALLHERLYDIRDNGSVDFSGYVHSLVASISHIVPLDAKLAIDVSDVSLSLDQALPCGLLLNELITNAIKHGSAPSADGRGKVVVTVKARREGDRMIIEVADNGPGFSDAVADKSLGLHLVRTLTRQLEGTVSFESSDGACVRVVFPVDIDE